MRNGITFSLSKADRERLSGIVVAPLSPQEHVWPARIILLSSDGLATSASKATTVKSKTCVWRWQERFMHEGVYGLLRDKSRPPSKAPVPPKRAAEIIRFLNRIQRGVPKQKASHVTLNNYAAHKKDKGQEWLARHPHWAFHFTPTLCSWLNAVEGFFAKLSRRRLKHSAFHSLVDLQTAINRFIREYNASDPKPFAWRTDSDEIIAARNQGHQTLELTH